MNDSNNKSLKFKNFKIIKNPIIFSNLFFKNSENNINNRKLRVQSLFTDTEKYKCFYDEKEQINVKLYPENQKPKLNLLSLNLTEFEKNGNQINKKIETPKKTKRIEITREKCLSSIGFNFNLKEMSKKSEISYEKYDKFAKKNNFNTKNKFLYFQKNKIMKKHSNFIKNQIDDIYKRYFEHKIENKICNLNELGDYIQELPRKKIKGKNNIYKFQKFDEEILNNIKKEEKVWKINENTLENLKLKNKKILECPKLFEINFYMPKYK